MSIFRHRLQGKNYVQSREVHELWTMRIEMPNRRDCHGQARRLSMKDISKAIHKVDSDEKISGTAKYTDDYVMENMLYAKTVCYGFKRHHRIN